MSCKQQELQEHSAVRWFPEQGARVGLPSWPEAADRLHSLQDDVVDAMRPVLHQCGFFGCRVGEASNPGPVQTRSGSRFVVLSSESDDETPMEVERQAAAQGRGRAARKRLRLSQVTTVPASVVDALEEDLCGDGASERTATPGGRVLVEPCGSQVHHSVSRHAVLALNVEEDLPTTVPATSGQVRAVHEEGRCNSPVNRSTHVDSSTDRRVNTTLFDMTAADTEIDAEEPAPHVWPARRRFHSRAAARNEARMSGSDTETLGSDVRGGVSEGDSVEEEEPEPSLTQPVRIAPRRLDISHGLQSLDGVDLKTMFSRRGVVMKSVPKFLQGAWRAALRIALEEVSTGRQVGDIVRQMRAWKLFLLLPRMLLHRKARGGAIPKHKLEERFAWFVAGRWLDLLESARRTEEQAQQSSVRRRRRHSTDDLAKRAERAVTLVQMGEVSRARQALEGAQLAPGTLDTLRALTDPRKRPPVPREVLSRRIQQFQPREQFVLDAVQQEAPHQ